jgi:hypothetical protein
MRNPLVAAFPDRGRVTLATRSAALAVATLVAAAVGHAWIVRVEEPRLTARFSVPRTRPTFGACRADAAHTRRREAPL